MKHTRLVFLEPYSLGGMMIDAYKSINKLFTPSKYDIDTLIKVMDRDGDGKVSLADVENLVVKLMCGERAN